MIRSRVTEDVVGKWPSVLTALGVEKRFLQNKHGPCPLCEGGKDRFRFDDKAGKGTWFCSQCGAGDGWALVMKLKSWDFKKAAQEVESLVGSAQPIKIRNGPSEAEVRKSMNTLWRSAKPLVEVRATALWWANRTGQIPLCPDVRAVDLMSCDHIDQYPGMVALVRGPDGVPVNLHRTFLTPQGEKANIDSPRRVMPMPMPKGSAVRLRPAAERMGVAEGLETAEAAAILHNVPVWATINAVNLESFTPPEGVKEVIVYGDNDRSATGQHVSWGLVRRLRRLGIKAWPELPETEGEDWDDVLMRKLFPGVAA